MGWYLNADGKNVFIDEAKTKLVKISSLDTRSESDKQIGCGYCGNELTCQKRDPKINKAKEGCSDWVHWIDKHK